MTAPLPTFVQLNDGWNAFPNGAEVDLSIRKDVLIARFLPNACKFPEYQNIPTIALIFEGCSKLRITSVNDEGWYRGQCRFSGIAPKWGEFYEILGDTRDHENKTEWRCAAGTGERHFHFYMRDETLEVKADAWKMEKAAPKVGNRLS